MDGSMMIPEFDHEMANTRRASERVPEDKFDWKPHEKSYSLHQLAAHLAEIPKWTGVTVNLDLFDMDEPYDRVVPDTKDAILDSFDNAVAEAREILERATGEDLMKTWSLKKDGEISMSMPKVAVLRSFIFNHNVHHRAQLGVYLRLLDVPVPATYGPSADEQN